MIGLLMLGGSTFGSQMQTVTRMLILLAFFSTASFAGIITTSYLPTEHTKVEITGTASVIWTATFDFVSNLLPDFTASPLLSEEFATAVTTWQKGMAFVSEAKSELVTNILATGIEK